MTNKITKLKILGKNIQQVRKNKGLSQNKLAELVDISREHLAKIETAKRCISMGLLFKIADLLGVSERDLLDFSAENEAR